MKRLKIICGLALALLMGLAAQPAWGPRPHGGFAPTLHAPSIRAAPRQAAPSRPNARPGGQRPGAYRPGVNARPLQSVQRPNNAANPAANANRENGVTCRTTNVSEVFRHNNRPRFEIICRSGTIYLPRNAMR